MKVTLPSASQELNELRRNGVRSWDEAEIYENDQRKKAAEASKAAGDRGQRQLARNGTDDASVISQVLYCTSLIPSGHRRKVLV